jgi:hypothetical protein
MARTAKAAQSSSGAKHVASAAPEATEEAGIAGGDTPITSESSILNTHRGMQRDGKQTINGALQRVI